MADTPALGLADDADVPDLVYAVADLMHDHGIPMATAVRMIRDMLTEATDEPDVYRDQLHVDLR